MAARDSAESVEKLRARLRKRVAQAVDSVCAQWELDRQHEASMQSNAGFDESYSYCKRLVTYIASNMHTSQDFEQQMDRVILACFSDAPKRVLREVVTNEVWFRSPEEAQVNEVNDDDGGNSYDTSLEVDEGGADKCSESVVKQERRAFSGKRSDVADGAVPGLEQREVAGSLLTKRPRSRTSKKLVSTKRSLQSLAAEPKLTRRQVVTTVDSSAEEDTAGDTESDEEQEEKKRAKTTHTTTRRSSVLNRNAETLNERGSAGVVDDAGLLTFEEAIGELCYADRRSLEQTAFFKERLRKSIRVVDALLCNPPTGKTCSRNCKHIRASMCRKDLPCQDKTCRIWHDVEAHTDRCKNDKCEFKLRILARETMHKIQHEQQEIKDVKSKLQKKKETLYDYATRPVDSKSFEHAIQTIEEDIAKIEGAISIDEAELAQSNAALGKYWARLNDIGINTTDDVIDKFPDFATHYVSKKKRSK